MQKQIDLITLYEIINRNNEKYQCNYKTINYKCMSNFITDIFGKEKT